jgi:hypothetical protein
MFARLQDKIHNFKENNQDRDLDRIEEATRYSFRNELAPIVSLSLEKCLNEQVVGPHAAITDAYLAIRKKQDKEMRFCLNECQAYMQNQFGIKS